MFGCLRIGQSLSAQHPGTSETVHCAACVFSGYQRSLFSELAALRRQLRSEQQRIEISLQQGDCGETDSPLSDRSEQSITLAEDFFLLILDLCIHHNQTTNHFTFIQKFDNRS